LKKNFLILISNLTLFAFFLIVFEVFLRFQNKNIKSSSTETERVIRLRELNPNSLSYFRPSSSYLKYSPSLENKIYRVETDSNGYIMPSGKEDSQIKIVFHGGSTTECLYVTENKRFPYLVQEKLKVEFPNQTIGTWNSGFSGNNSMHSINTLLNKTLALKPTHVVLMNNGNDLTQLLRAKNSYWTKSKDNFLIDKRLIFNKNEENYFKKTLKKSFLIQKLRFIKIKFFTKNQEDFYDYSRNQHISKLFSFKDKRDFTNEIFEKYKSQLKTFIGIAKAHNIKPVLMTQANRLVLDLDSSIMRPETVSILDSYGLSYQTIVNAYSEFNNIIRNVAKEESINLIDLEKEIPKTQKYIYDIFHFNDNGSEKVAEIITNKFTEILKSEF